VLILFKRCFVYGLKTKKQLEHILNRQNPRRISFFQIFKTLLISLSKSVPIYLHQWYSLYSAFNVIAGRNFFLFLFLPYAFFKHLKITKTTSDNVLLILLLKLTTISLYKELFYLRYGCNIFQQSCFIIL